MISNEFAANSIRLARVTHVHPEGQKMEVIFLDTGDYGRDVQVMSPYAGSDFGFTSGIPAPGVEGHDANMTNDQGGRHITAVIANIQGVHIALGFLYPQVTQMAFTKAGDADRMIERNPSDFYRSVSGAADMDMVHPSGAYLRIGQGDQPDDLTGRDFDGKWKTTRNQTPATVTLSVNGSIVRLHPDGGVSIETENSVTVQAAQSIAIQAGQAVAISAGSQVTISAPLLYTKTPLFLTEGVHRDDVGGHI